MLLPAIAIASILFGVTILLSGDVELNPGPPKYPCGECGKACTSYKGAKASILCDTCNTWFHAECVNLSDPIFSVLGRTDLPWECCSCGLPNFSSGLFDATLDSTNNTDSFSSCPSSPESVLSDQGAPIAASSPARHHPTGCVPSKLRILVINVQSILSKKAELACLICATKPDIIVGCETWLKPAICQGEFFPDDYRIYRKDRSDGYGGVLVAVHTSLNSHQITTETNAEFVAAKILSGKQSVVVGSFYRPPNDNKDHMYELNQAIANLCTHESGSAVWLAGDMNLPDIDWSSDQVVRHQYSQQISESFLQLLARTGLEQVVSFPTRGNNTLDIVVTNRPSLVNRCECAPGLSDHDIVFLDANIQADRVKPARRKIHLWKRADLDVIRIKADAWAQDFVNKHSATSSVEMLAGKIQAELLNILDTHVPSKMTSTRRNQSWFNTQTKRVTRRKARAHKKARRTNKEHDWSRYRRLRSEAQRICRQAYNKHISDLIGSDPSSNKRLGALVKSLKADQLGVSPLKEGGLLHSDPQAKANIMNKQFASVFTDEGDIPLPDLGEPKTPKMKPINVTCAGVAKLLRNLKPHKATGPDGIPARLLRETAEQIAPAVTLLFQASLDQGKVPSLWKAAHVVPIFKKGSRSSAENYRPISLTSILSKLCEHIVHCAISNHLDAHSVLADAQHGFRKRRSCETQLILTVDDLAKGLDDKSQIDMILLDFSKAFDKVAHNRLLLKIGSYGITGLVLEWIRDFLSGRTQRVVLEGQSSLELPVTSGVPQGSVLGPLLFLIYINDLPDSVSTSTTRLFADDTVLYKRISSVADATCLQNDLDALQLWEDKWMMEFNPSKCQVLRVTQKRKPLAASYTIHGETLDVVTSAKLLGVTIDSKLNFNDHVSAVSKKACGVRAFLNRNIKTQNRKVKAAAYTSYVRPTVEYASTVWDPHTQKNINKLEQVQRTSARYVTGNYDYTSSVSQMTHDLQWPTLAERRKHSRLTMMFKIIKQLVDIDSSAYLTWSQSATRGHCSRLLQYTCNSNAYASSFFPRTIRDWNSLPVDPLLHQTVDGFKAHLISHPSM